MEFWGVEVKPGGKKVPCKPGEDTYLHVTQAALGESNSKNAGQQERVVIKVDVGNKEVVLGTLTQGKCDQMALDLIFDRDFKLSHNGTQSSVYFCGYQTESARDEFYTSDEDEDEDEAGDVPSAVRLVKDNGGHAEKPVAAKLESGKEEPKAEVNTPCPTAPTTAAATIDEDEDDSDEEENEQDDDEEDDDDDEDDDVEEADVKQAWKKRGAPVAAAVPSSAKKVKVAGISEKQVPKIPEVAKQKGPVAPPSTDGKTKGKKIPDATPKDIPKQGKSPKRLGDYKCTPCSKTFTTESGLAQHNSAKHSA